MNKYKLKKLVKGYKLKPSLKGLTLVAIPDKYQRLINNNFVVRVECEGLTTLLTKSNRLLHKEMQKCKFNNGKWFTLYYYEWQPNKRQISLF